MGVAVSRRRRHRKELPALENGDRLDQRTFHARYEAMPDDARAELIGGIVFMSSPQKPRHGRYSVRVIHGKKDDYEKAGVREYMVVALRTHKVFWFVRRRGKFKELAPDADGIVRSEAFPGLWLDPAALLRRDGKRLLAVLRQGLASPEHAAFVAKAAGK